MENPMKLDELGTYHLRKPPVVVYVGLATSLSSARRVVAGINPMQVHRWESKQNEGILHEFTSNSWSFDVNFGDGSSRFWARTRF